jgi:hypothetical protein
MNSAPRRIDDDSSSRAPDSQASRGTLAARRGAAAAVLLGALAAIAATFLPVLRVAIDRELEPSLDRTGWDLHGPALLALAILAVVLLPAAVRGVTAAAAAVTLIGFVLLGIVLLGDLPDVDDTGLVGGQLVEGTLRAGTGAYAEALAGALVLLGGGVLVALRE